MASILSRPQCVKRTWCNEIDVRSFTTIYNSDRPCESTCEEQPCVSCVVSFGTMLFNTLRLDLKSVDRQLAYNSVKIRANAAGLEQWLVALFSSQPWPQHSGAVDVSTTHVARKSNEAEITLPDWYIYIYVYIYIYIWILILKISMIRNNITSMLLTRVMLLRN